MLTLDEHGLLTPGGLLNTTLEEVEQVFVQYMPLSSNRALLFDLLAGFIKEVKSQINNEPFSFWLDGSFTANKLNPGDIDIVLFTNHTSHSQFNHALDQLRTSRKPFIDSYFIPVYPLEHKKYSLFNLSCTEWLYVFGTSREYKNKGILSLNA